MPLGNSVMSLDSYSPLSINSTSMLAQGLGSLQLQQSKQHTNEDEEIKRSGLLAAAMVFACVCGSVMTQRCRRKSGT